MTLIASADAELLYVAGGLWIALIGAYFQFLAAEVGLQSESSLNDAAVHFTIPANPLNIGTHIREWNRLLRSVPYPVAQAIRSYRYQRMGWLILLLGSGIGAVASTYAAFP